MAYELPQLSYTYDALEPWIDAQTMELHHGKHHATYVAKLNEALAKHPELTDASLPELLSDLNRVPEDIRTAVRNHGGGHYNHSFFWTVMGPNPSEAQPEPEGALAEALTRDFGSVVGFREKFTAAALGVFGSGWTWLVQNQENKLQVVATANQDSPISQNLKPLLTLDLWEHAYYLKHQNRRPDYVAAWWHVVNWGAVTERFLNSG